MSTAFEPDAQRASAAGAASDAPTLHALVGTTAVGKSRLALRVAELAGAEIVSLDSMQVYRGMDIGTAKADASERERVRHHMLDLVGPQERYDVQRYLADLRGVLHELGERRARALFVGGTGFYLKALTSGLFEGPPIDRELRARIEGRVAREGNRALHAELSLCDPICAARIHVNDTKRLVRALEVFEQTGRALSDWQQQWSATEAASAARSLVGLELSAPELEQRIRARVLAMLDAGWIEEARAIRSGAGFGPTAVQALGYREVLALADGSIERDECVLRITLATRQFARKQRTWYRKFADIRWFQAPAVELAPDAETRLARELVEALGWTCERAGAG